jgi:hypothetical protein
MQLSPLLPSSPHPQADALEVFEGYRPLRAFGKLNDAFTDDMVRVGDETTLLTRKFLQASSFGLGASALKLLPQTPVTVSDAVDYGTAMDVSIGIGCYVLDAKINADHSLSGVWFRSVNLASGEQIPLTPAVSELGFAHAALQESHLLLSSDKGYGESPTDSPD